MAFNPPATGELRHRVELQNKSQAASGSDTLADTFTVVATVWGRARALFGGRIVEGAQVSERATHVVTIRWRDDVGSWDHLELGPVGARRRFRVVSVMDPDEGRTWLEILAEELKRGV